MVVTSSRAAVQYAPARRDHVVTASDWTRLDRRGLGACVVSKVRAERAAWDIAGRRGVRDRLAVINPGAVIGPLLGDDPGTSVSAIQQIMAGALPMVPDLRLPWVHVRDVADAHIEAMTSEMASAHYTIVATDPSSLIDVAAVLRERLPEASGKISQAGDGDMAHLGRERVRTSVARQLVAHRLGAALRPRPRHFRTDISYLPDLQTYLADLLLSR